MFGLGLLRMGIRKLSQMNNPEEAPQVNVLGRLAKAMSQKGLKKNKDDEFDETPTGDPLGTYGKYDDTYKW